MPTGYTTVTASYLQDATGTPLTNATISFQPVDNKGNPISFRSGGNEGQTISQPLTAVVTNGVFTIQLADTSLTTPVNVGYAVTVKDNVSGKLLLHSGYGCIQPTGSTWSLDAYTPNTPAQAVIQTGPAGQSAYQAAVANGYEGSESAWLASLIGATGTATSSSGISLLLSGVTEWVLNTLSTTINPKWLYSINDSLSRLLFGIETNGDTTIGANLRGKMSAFIAQNLTVGGLFNGLKITTGTDARGALATLNDSLNRQLIRFLGTGQTQIPGGLVVNNGLQVNGSGTFTYNGRNVLCAVATFVIHTFRLGQSNSLGFSAENAFGGTSREGNLMLCTAGDLVSVYPDGPGPYVGVLPLQEANIDNVTYPSGSSAPPGTNQSLGETGTVANADARSKLYRQRFLAHQQYVYSIAAVGATSILTLYGAGQPCLATFSAQVAAAKQQYGSAYTADWGLRDQGESDAGNTGYYANILTAGANLQAAYQTASGNTNTFRIMAAQQSSTPSYYGDSRGNIMDTAYAWMQAAPAHPTQFFVSQPLYSRNCMLGSAQHIGAAGAVAKALIEARTQYRHDYEGGTGNGLRFASVNRSGTLITIFLEVPVAPIVIDTTIISAIANYGIEYSNTPPGGGTTPTITSVSLTRPDGALSFQANCLYVVLSADPGAATNEMISSAYTVPSGGDATLGTGARSNIRDSDKLLIESFPDQQYPGGGAGINPYNWLCVDRMAVNVVAA